MVKRLSYKHARAHAVSFVYGRRSRGVDGRRSRGLDGRRSRGIDGRRCMHRLAQHSKYCPEMGGGGGGGGGEWISTALQTPLYSSIFKASKRGVS